ncbi:hypothetical protein [Frankia sp. AgKG'84/4]|uniref:hypothetical protein n=1 Tax=Frankia sp. AgKG'84/4 TaxID=573490 RepID=UPI00202A6E82|nr:hypothetical protein [Frankia sp. AgKG'84/4]MCL9794161.1 hypothetical protein [Frankia sp. AgKG'84/4]
MRAFGGEHGEVVADLVDDLRATISPGEGLSLVSKYDGAIVGQAMFTPWHDAVGLREPTTETVT